MSANFSGGEANGDYRLEYHEESVNCESSYGGPQPFEARRYLPIGGSRTVAPVPGESRVFYDHGGPTRFFARATPTWVTGLRGVIRSRCPIRRNPPRDRPLALFPRVGNARLQGGRFVRIARDNGLMLYSGVPYVETIAIFGGETKEALTGTYIRVHTIKPPDSKPRRCVTGPLPIEARRYLPAKR